MQTTNAWAPSIDILVPWHQETATNTKAKHGGWDYTHALTTRFRNDGSTLCLLGLTGSGCGWGEELWEDGVKVDCISGRTVQVCRSIPGTAMGCVERDVGEGR